MSNEKLSLIVKQFRHTRYDVVSLGKTGATYGA